mmetsp:Transcript_2248/g.7164  ORF Transcript_2248/g.7164 Transcript_2248/m.7164 type:complete len:268 (-) Transcript_2248:299-1102(-)
MTLALEETSEEADSMRSGRSVPWARKTSSAVSPRLLTMACVTRMKVSPMILRLSSGRHSLSSGSEVSPLTSVTALAKSSVASSASMGRPSAPSASTTSLDSLCRMKPWSMCNAMTRSGPRALCSSAAHTEESTPPETRTRTRLSPTDSRMYSIADCSRQAIVYEPERPHTLKRKLEKIALPSTDRSTSGWNCTPYSRFSSHSIAATMSPERPVTRNPSAGVSIESPCVRSTSVFSPIPSKSLDSPSSLTSNTPSSRLAFLATVPPWA